ncbi:MAG: hypothetical protein IJS08_10665, partial [Victivallales bacterium]|nr:hypothetical protein [Victivallales bacterium]
YSDKGLTRNTENGHAVTVYGFTYDESKKGTAYYTGVIIADSDDDYYLGKGTPASSAPNRIKICPIEYNSNKGVYVFTDYNRPLYGVINGFQYLAQRPSSITYSGTSNVGFATKTEWNSSYSVGISAEAAQQGATGNITVEDNVFVALNLTNYGLGISDTFTISAVVDGDEEHEQTFQVTKSLDYNETDAETVLNLGKLAQGTHNISITVNNEEADNAITIRNLLVTRGTADLDKLVVSSGSGMIGLASISGQSVDVTSNASTTGICIQENGVQNIKANGSANGSLVHGLLTVEAEGTANNTEVFENGVFVVQGTADGTTVHAGGTLFANQGSTVTNTTIETEGLMNVDFSGSISETDIYGELKVFNGTATGNHVYANGQMLVFDTGIASGTIVENIGTLTISSGGYAEGNSFSGSQSALYVLDEDSLACDNTFNGASQNVSDGGTVENSVLDNASVQFLSNGAMAINTELRNASMQYIDNAVAYDTVVYSGSTAFVYDGGLSVDCIVKTDAYIAVGEMEEACIASIRNLTVEYGGIALFNEGTLISGINTIAGTLAVSGNVTGTLFTQEDISPRLSFDFTGRKLADGYMVSNIDLIDELNFSLILDENQAMGAYKFATTAPSDFSGDFEVVDNNGVSYGALTCGGELVFGDKLITLTQNNTSIFLQVSENIYGPYEIPASSIKIEGNTCSWGHIANSTGYVVELSRDNFETVFTIVTSDEAFTVNNLPYDIQWRVRAQEAPEWTNGASLPASTDTDEGIVYASKNWNQDVLFAKSQGIWESNYTARHLGGIGSWGSWTGTKESVALIGKNKIVTLFEGSSDTNVLLLTDDSNGDALFVDDIYSAFPEEYEAQARLAKIDEIRAGAGDDIVDMTSLRFEYIGDDITIRGGMGDDVIWANHGSNLLFGDAGNDRLVGANGNDILAGGIGNDAMHGGGGNDVFTFCDSWGQDSVEQLATGTVTLWFKEGNQANWNAETLTYADGDNSVTVSGIGLENITLKFGNDGSEQYQSLLAAGAFEDATSERIFENQNLLA